MFFICRGFFGKSVKLYSGTFSFKIFGYVRSKYLSPMVWGFQSSWCSAYLKRRPWCNLITGNRNFIVEKSSDSRGFHTCWQKHSEILLKLDIISWNTILFLCCEGNGAFVDYTSNQVPILEVSWSLLSSAFDWLKCHSPGAWGKVFDWLKMWEI